ncbi:MAG: 3-hydroxyanthranilate 3,4-dioxygenase [Archangium sp.]
MSRLQPLNFKKWIEEHRHLLKPPVGNQVVWQDQEFIVMVVGGPNSRTDFHIDESEEFFYQLEGNIHLRIIEDGKPRDLPIHEGDIFLLPPKVPHSPQRPAGTVGLVIERRRQPHELDGFAWYCPRCDSKLYDEYLHVTNIVTQLPPVFDRFYGNPENCTCKKCGFQMTREKRAP